MVELLLDEAQKALREKTQRHSQAGQTTRFATAIRRALDGVNEDISLEGAPPSMEAALAALGAGQAHLLTNIKDRGTRQQLKAHADNCRKHCLSNALGGPDPDNVN